MLKVLILDDEQLHRKSIIMAVPWENLDLAICGEARNGRMGLELVNEFKPDICIVDINMPIMNGLEFIKAASEKSKRTKYIITTGYSEFELVKEAMEYGAMSYILKPVNEKELINALLKAKESIEAESSKTREFEMVLRQLQDSIPLLRDKFLNDLLKPSNYLTSDQIRNEFDFLGIKLSNPYFLTAVIEVDYDSEADKNAQVVQIQRFTIQKLTAEVLSSQYSYETCFIETQQLCVIISFESNDARYINSLEACFNNIRQLVYTTLNISVSIGLGDVHKGLDSLHASFSEASTALRSKIIQGENSVILYKNIQAVMFPKDIFNTEQRLKLTVSVRAADMTSAMNEVKLAFKKMQQVNISLSTLYMKCFEIISACNEAVSEFYDGNDKMFNKPDNIINEFMYLKSISELEKYILDYTAATVQTIRENFKKGRNSKIVADAMAYINDHYTDENLNIEVVSKNLYANYSYLCTKFKQESGTTINAYINDIRMKKALYLLESEECSVQDVAYKVGFSDPNYFSKCFRKHYGKSPTSFKV